MFINISFKRPMFPFSCSMRRSTHQTFVLCFTSPVKVLWIARHTKWLRARSTRGSWKLRLEVPRTGAVGVDSAVRIRSSELRGSLPFQRRRSGAGSAPKRRRTDSSFVRTDLQRFVFKSPNAQGGSAAQIDLRTARSMRWLRAKSTCGLGKWRLKMTRITRPMKWLRASATREI